MKRASVKRQDSKLALQCLQIQSFFRREVLDVVRENYLFTICNLQQLPQATQVLLFINERNKNDVIYKMSRNMASKSGGKKNY